MHSESVSHHVPPVDVGGAAGEVAAVELQRILYTQVSAGQDLVGEVYLGVTERERRGLLILGTPADCNSLPRPASCWPGVAYSVTGEAGGGVDKSVIVTRQGGYERFVRQPWCLHHDWAAGSLPHDGESRQTEGVRLAGHQSSHGLLQARAEDLQQQYSHQAGGARLLPTSILSVMVWPAIIVERWMAYPVISPAGCSGGSQVTRIDWTDSGTALMLAGAEGRSSLVLQ